MGHESAMPKITYSPSKGLVQEAGTGVVFQGESISFAATPFSPVQEISATGAVTAPGVYTITSSTGGAKTVTLPSVSAFPGANFVFRVNSVDAHILTGSSADQKAVFTGLVQVAAGTAAAKVGSKLTFAAVAGTSVVLVSDGSQYCITGGSGSFALSETIPA
jgi:hypothetical protein